MSETIIVPGDDVVVLPDPPSVEIRTQRRLTTAFIETQPVYLSLVPRTKTRKPSGGWAWSEQTPREPQTLRLIEQSGIAGQPVPRVTVDGVERRVDFELLGEYDAEIERGDVFSYQGKEWEVIDLYFDNGYETRAQVSSRG